MWWILVVIYAAAGVLLLACAGMAARGDLPRGSQSGLPRALATDRGWAAASRRTWVFFLAEGAVMVLGACLLIGQALRGGEGATVATWIAGGTAALMAVLLVAHVVAAVRAADEAWLEDDDA